MAFALLGVTSPGATLGVLIGLMIIGAAWLRARLWTVLNINHRNATRGGLTAVPLRCLRQSKAAGSGVALMTRDAFELEYQLQRRGLLRAGCLALRCTA